MKHAASWFLLILMAVPAQAGAFKDACMASAGSALSETTCTCQEKLAETTLNPAELKAIIASASDKKADYVAAINAMTSDEASNFRDKVRDLSDAVDAKCPAIPQ